MQTERLKRGMERLREVNGSAGEQVISSLEDVAPDLGLYILWGCLLPGGAFFTGKRDYNDFQFIDRRWV